MFDIAWRGVFSGVGVAVGLGAVVCGAAGQTTETLKIIADDAYESAGLGNRVALSGTLAAASAYGTFTLSITGAAYLFDATTGAQLAKLDLPLATGNTLIVEDVVLGDGFVGVTSRVNGLSAATTRVHLFSTADPTNPVLLTSIASPESPADDAFGYATAIDGDRLLVGAWADRNAAGVFGAAYLFDVSDPASPLLLSKLTSADTGNVWAFGWSVALDGDIAVIGARWDDTIANQAGAAHVFDISDLKNPVETAKLVPLDGAEQDFFGYSVGVAGDVAVVGSIFNDEGGFAAGAAYVYDLTDRANPVLARKILVPDTAETFDFGWSIAMEGTRALIGARSANTFALDEGAAYLYELSDPANPALLTKLGASDGTANDLFGWDVALSADTALIGAYGEDAGASNTGALYVFDVSAGPTACNAADLAEPFDSLTFADISAFLVAFTGSDAAADLAAPTGQFTFADIAAFLGAFTAGCP